MPSEPVRDVEGETEPETPRVKRKPVAEKSVDLRSSESRGSGNDALDLIYKLNMCAAGWGVGLWLELARGFVHQLVFCGLHILYCKQCNLSICYFVLSFYYLSGGAYIGAIF